MSSFFVGFANGLADQKTRSNDRADRNRAFDLEQQRLDQEAGMGVRPPPTGTAPQEGPMNVSTGAGVRGVSGPVASGGIFDLIDKTEGGGRYDTLFGHSQRDGGRFAGVDVSNMTVGEVLDFTSPSGEYGQWVKGRVGRVATPTGRHQIVGSTLRQATNELGIRPDTPYNARTQDTIAYHLADRRLASASTMSGKIAALRAEWEGFKNVSDEALASAIMQYESARGRAQASYGVPQPR